MPEYKLRVAFRSTAEMTGYTGNVIVNTFHLVLAAATAISDWNAVANEINTGVGTEYKNVLNNGVRWNDILVQTEPVADPGTSVGVKNINAVGTRVPADAGLGLATTALAAVKTNTPKRYARGRMWLPPMVGKAALTTGGLVDQTNAYYTTAVAFLNKLLSGFSVGGNDYSWIIYSKRQADQGFSPDSFEVTGYVIRTEPHYLRSRVTAP